MAPRLSEFRTKITQNEALFSRVRAVYEGDEPVTSIETTTFESASDSIEERQKWVVLTLEDRPFDLVEHGGGELRFVHKLPVRARFPDLVLKRGLLVDSVVRTSRARHDPAVAALRIVERLGPWPVQPLVARADLDRALADARGVAARLDALLDAFKLEADVADIVDRVLDGGPAPLSAFRKSIEGDRSAMSRRSANGPDVGIVIAAGSVRPVTTTSMTRPAASSAAPWGLRWP